MIQRRKLMSEEERCIKILENGERCPRPKDRESNYCAEHKPKGGGGSWLFGKRRPTRAEKPIK
jgi:hypothetical protein